MASSDTLSFFPGRGEHLPESSESQSEVVAEKGDKLCCLFEQRLTAGDSKGLVFAFFLLDLVSLLFTSGLLGNTRVDVRSCLLIKHAGDV